LTGPKGAGKVRKSALSTDKSMAGLPRLAADIHRLTHRDARGPQYNFFKPALRRLQLGLAMGLESLPTLVKGNGILKVHGPLLQPRDDLLKLLERSLETQGGDFWLGFFGNGSLLKNFSQKFNN
jgi:hypothetical protein